MPSAEIIAIGTELLLGEIVDTNTQFIARALRDLGIDLYRAALVGDNAARIAQTIQEALGRADIIITTGGLGPTVDDPTREAVAQAFGVPTEFRPELWEQIQARFQRFARQPTENNRRQAYVPQGALAVENPVGTAPAFIIERCADVGAAHASPLQRPNACAVISLPGVPREMEYLLEHAVIPYLRERFGLQGIIKTRVLHTAGAGESQIDERIGDLELLTNPTVGLAAHSGQVDVRIAVKAASEAQADALIAPVEESIRQRLSKWVFGADGETLEGIARQALAQRGWKLAVIEAGLSGELIRRLNTFGEWFCGAEALAAAPEADELQAITDRFRQAHGAEVGLGVAVRIGAEKHEVFIVLISPEGRRRLHRPFGGPPEYATRWAANHGLNLVRELV